MSGKIEKVNSLSETKFLSLYDINYKNKLNKSKSWIVASRKDLSELEEVYYQNKEDNIDAVVIVPFHKKQNKLVLIKQYRVPIIDYIYEMPAGLVDNKEDIYSAVKRELKEETGLDIISMCEMSKDKLYLSPGMTDESVALTYCVCDGEISYEYQEEDEDIKIVLVSQEEAMSLLKTNEKIDAKTYLVLQLFIMLGEKLFIK